MEMTSIPRLAAGCRLHPTADILLVPEGTLNLSGPSRQILIRVDGQRTVTAIVDDLLLQFEGAGPDEVGQDVLGLLKRMQERGVVRT
jgi:pyrroloquinoline quinone biosynthesis protein D